MVPTPVPTEADCCPPTLSLQLCVRWPGGRWQAQVTAPGGEALQFDSPFELVRYLTQLAPQPCAPPPQPGLR
jgi:hypothetical protein